MIKDIVILVSGYLEDNDFFCFILSNKESYESMKRHKDLKIRFLEIKEKKYKKILDVKI